MNHYPHHLGDYAKDTLGLSMAEHGAYRLLLDAYYASEVAPLAEEVYAIAKAGTPAERKAVDKVLRKFELRDGRYYHKRVEEELAAFRIRSAEAAEKANKRWAKQNAGTMPRHMPQHVPQDMPEHMPQHQPQHSHGNAGAMLASSHKPVKPSPEEEQSSVGDPSPERATAALSLVLTQDGRITDTPKGRMHLTQWASEGVTTTHLEQAVRMARQRKPHPELIPFAYLVPIVEDVKAGRAFDPDEPRGKDAIPEAMRRIAEREAKDSAPGPAAAAA